jgi:preprotein translocase subunit SecA
MRRFNGETLESLLNRLNLPDDVPIEAKMVTRAIKSAQTQVEQQNFEIRKHVLKYDEVMNQQRKVIYAERKRILEGENLKEQALQMVRDVVTAYVNGATAEGYAEDWDLDQLWTALKQLYPVGIDHKNLTHRHNDIDDLTSDELLDALLEDAERAYAERETEIDGIAGESAMRQLERNVLLNIIDRKWREHLYEMDYLREGIQLRAHAQRDPLVEYQREGYDMFVGMLDGVKEESVGFLFNVVVEAAPAPAVAPVATPEGLTELAESGAAGAQDRGASTKELQLALAALRAKEIDGEAAAGERHLTYSGPSEDGSAQVQRRNGGEPAAAGVPARATRRERREAARRQGRGPKPPKTRRA